ncbi:DMT family transporter [Flavivirga amylovorans]|uniref:DMT family transporter n=1 Tax=Flavivirga amylovorans TaxID=870486 RepID=A0ABT8WVS2_9FLAO|nr:DMT family transporter [Flavivirga amylovorans]MDO5985774.1 DMT family transporter [Flavivirga amylovorans]
MNNQHIKNVLELSFATLIVSSSAVLGKYIDMPTPLIIWWRASLALIILYVFCRIKKISLKIYSTKDKSTFFLSALFLGAHWLTYFYSIKLSNVSIGILSLFTFPAITSILEPLFTRTKVNKIHLLMGVLVLIGIYMLVPEFNIENSDVKGILWGVFSALFFSLRNIIIKNSSQKYNGTMIMMYQLLIVTIVLSPVLYFLGISEIKTQYPYIIMLALLATAIGHSLFIKSLKHFSASTASIIISTQPLYAIILAFIFLKEIPDSNIFIGGTLIVSTVIVESILSKKR